MSKSPHVEALLILKKQVLDKIKEKMPAEVQQLEAIELAINATSQAQSGEYSHYKMGLDALVAYLKKVGHPVNKSKACRDVVDGGWSPGDENAYWKLIDMVRYQLEDAKRPKLVKSKDGSIWLSKSVLGEPKKS